MAVPLSLGPVHHLRLTVTNVERSRAFYTELLGFQIAMADLSGCRGQAAGSM